MTSSSASISKVVLLEFIDEFEDFQVFVNKHELDINDFTIIALEFQLQVHLRKLGIGYKNTLDYFGNNSYKRVLLHSDNILTHVEENFTFSDCYTIRKAYITELQHYIELMFNYIAKTLEILQSVYEQNSNIELYASVKNRVNGSPFISNDRFLGKLVERFAATMGINFYYFGYSGDVDKSYVVNDKKITPSLLYHCLFKFLRVYLNSFNKTQILIPTKQYGFEKLKKKIKKKHSKAVFITLYEKESLKWYQRYGGIMLGLFSGHYFIDINVGQSSITIKEQDSLKNNINALFNVKGGNIFEYHGVKFSDIVEYKVRNAIAKHLHNMILWSHQLSYLSQKLDIKLLISPFGRGLWYLAAELFKKIGKPSLFISHGTHPVPIDRYHEISIFNMCRGFMLGDYSHIALSTPVQEGHLHYFKHKYNWIRNEEIRTAPLIFAAITDSQRLKSRAAKDILSKQKVVVHSVSLKLRGVERYYFLETMDEYLEGLSDVVSVLNSIDDAKLIIRLHPGFDYSDEDIKLFLPESNNYIISKSGAFEDVLSAADLLISYSSTTIDEALINKIPVLLYDKWNRYNHFKTGVFSTQNSPDIFPVCYVNRKEKLNEAITFMFNKIDSVKKDDINVSKYKYKDDYIDRFSNFIEESLAMKGVN